MKNLFNLVLIYIGIYFLQPGSRIELLGKVRFELLFGAYLMTLIIMYKGKIIFTKNPLNKAIFIFFGAMCLSFLGAVWTHTASHALTIFVRVIKLFAIYLMIIATIDSEKKIRKFMWVYLLMVFWVYTEPFILSLSGKNIRVAGDGSVHLYGLGQFEHYNSLGTIATTNLAFVYAFFRYYKNFFIRLMLLLFTLIALIVIVKTGSRTSYVGLLFLIGITALVSKHRIRNIILGCVGVIVAFPFIPPEYQERVFSLAQTAKVLGGGQVEDTIYSRWIIVQDAWKVFLKYPIVGCGLDSFYQLRGALFNRWQQSHNLYMQLLTNMGIIGLFAFFYLVKITLKINRSLQKQLIRLKATKSFMYYLSEAILIFITTRLIIGLFTHSLYNHYWWIPMGLVYVMQLMIQKYLVTTQKK